MKRKKMQEGFAPYDPAESLKTPAISIPDEVFHAAERLARRSKTSRSKLYSRALHEYVARHSPDAVTERMNAALAGVAEPAEPFTATAAAWVLRRTEW